MVGTGLTVNLMWLLNLPFNQANVLFVPLILGEGIEFGIIILARWRLEESARAITLPASTAKGVALAALTTTLGFGSLMVSGHQGTFSLGLLATVGSLSVLLASLSILPAFLRLVERTYRREPAFQPYLSLGRWLHHMIRKKDHEKTAWIWIISLALVAFWGWTRPALAESPTAYVRGILDQVMGLQNDPALSAQARSQAIHQIIERSFDFALMAKDSLGSTYERLSGGQRQEFTRTFSYLFQDSYTRLVLNFLEKGKHPVRPGTPGRQQSPGGHHHRPHQ